MTPTKALFSQIKENNEKYNEAINVLAMTNLNLNLCKTFLTKLVASDLSCSELKKDIKEFLEIINKQIK